MGCDIKINEKNILLFFSLLKIKDRKFQNTTNNEKQTILS